MAITFPASSASPWRDANGTVWSWNGGGWRRSASLPFAAVDGSDIAVAALVADRESSVRGALDARYTRPARLSPMMFADKARTGQFRVALIGMSIASFSSYMPTLARVLKQQHGDAAASHVDAGVLGGDFTSPFLGWEKQWSFAPPRLTRLRGKAASTSDLRFVVEGDTLRFHFACEADSEAANITVDGEVVGTTPAAGTQALGVLSEFSVASGPHEVTIARPSGDGYVYFESLEAFESTRPGVIAYNWTLGGSSLISTRVAGSASGAKLASVPLASEHTGTDAFYGRDDIDLFIVMHDVNELHPTYYATDFRPAFDRMIAKTRERPVPLVLVSSMAGHFSMPAGGSNYDGYAEIRALYAATRTAESHVEHVDWHTATALADLERYQDLDYPNVTDLDVDAGTYTGDFIHPANASRALFHLFTDVLHTPAPPTNDSDDFRWDHVRTAPKLGSSASRTTEQLEYVCAGFEFHDATDTFTTPTAHGLSVGDKVIFHRSAAPTGAAAMPGFTPGFWWVVATPTATTFQLSATEGGEAFTQAGSSLRSITNGFVYRVVSRTYRHPVEGGVLKHFADGATPGGPFLHVPIYRDETVTSITNTIRDGIATSETSDKWGRYYALPTTQNVTLNQVSCGQTFADGKGCVMLFRFTGQLGPRAVDGTFTRVVTPDGQNSPLTTVSLGRTEATVENLSGEPIVMAFHVNSTSNTAAVTIRGGNTRIYEAATVYGTVPVWPGQG